MLKIGIDLDDCITYASQFFCLLTNSLKGKAQIHQDLDTGILYPMGGEIGKYFQFEGDAF